MADDNPDRENLNDLEERFRTQRESEGYQEGLEKGMIKGRDEGYARGCEEGTKISSEIGIYRGLIMVWIQLAHSNLEHSSKLMKVVNRLYETLDMINSFPDANLPTCNRILSDIRSKFKLITSLLGPMLCDIDCLEQMGY